MELSLAVIASSNRRKTRRKNLMKYEQRITREEKTTSFISLRSAMVSASGTPVLIKFYTLRLKVHNDLINCAPEKASPASFFNALMELQLLFSAKFYRKSHIAVWSTGGEDSSGPLMVTLVDQFRMCLAAPSVYESAHSPHCQNLKCALIFMPKS